MRFLASGQDASSPRTGTRRLVPALHREAASQAVVSG